MGVTGAGRAAGGSTPVERMYFCVDAAPAQRCCGAAGAVCTGRRAGNVGWYKYLRLIGSTRGLKLCHWPDVLVHAEKVPRIVLCLHLL